MPITASVKDKKNNNSNSNDDKNENKNNNNNNNYSNSNNFEGKEKELRKKEWNEWFGISGNEFFNHSQYLNYYKRDAFSIFEMRFNQPINKPIKAKWTKSFKKPQMKPQMKPNQATNNSKMTSSEKFFKIFGLFEKRNIKILIYGENQVQVRSNIQKLARTGKH